MNRSKAKGTGAESAVADYLRSQGWSQVERRALAGAQDKGDIAGVPDTVIEVKNHATIKLAEFVDEANVERDNAGVEYGVAWIKRRGTTDPGKWYVAMDGATFCRLLVAAELS